MKSMTLELNETVEPYREFYGSNVQQMPLLISGKDDKGEVIDIPRIPLSVAGLMERRLNSSKGAWKDNYFDNGDAIVYHPDGKFKIVLDAQALREITPKSKLQNGALILADGMYEKMQGHEFTRNDAEIITGRELSPNEVKAHPIWGVVARDKTLLQAYVEKMFPEMKERFSYETAMGVYLASKEKVPTLRVLFAYRLENWSRLRGLSNLDCGDGRFAGVAPEALSAPGKAIVIPSLETALSIVNQHLGKTGIELRAK